jgi:6-phosphogluconolactonase/glucosamine-6-phosphate isomerase/deaminase
MQVITSQNPAVTASDQLNEVLSSYAARPILLMLSGGSALSILEHVDVLLLGPHVTITTLDERFSTDPTINNFSQITATEFYKKAMEQGTQSIPTIIKDGDTLREVGKRFDSALHHWKESHRDGVVVATMGVGSDGHTAGVFPHQPSLDPLTTDWVVSYEVPPEVNPHVLRITTTPAFLKTQVTQAICLITGEEKRNVFNQLMSTQCSSNDMPACIMKEMSLVKIVTDINV